MLNTFWEELNMSTDIHEFHNKKSQDMELPNWIKDLNCPFCKKKILVKDFRKIALCLNARNFGEIAVEFACTQCEKMDTLYFRSKICKIEQFIDYIKKQDNISVDPILEEDMYKMRYNNVASEMASSKNG